MSYPSVYKRADPEAVIPNGALVVISDYDTSTIRAFDDTVDPAADVLGVKIDKTNTLLIKGFNGVLFYDYDTWTWSSDLTPVFSGEDQVPNPDFVILNPFSNTELELIMIHGIAPILKTVSPDDIPAHWKLIRTQAEPALHDIYQL